MLIELSGTSLDSRPLRAPLSPSDRWVACTCVSRKAKFEHIGNRYEVCGVSSTAAKPAS